MNPNKTVKSVTAMIEEVKEKIAEALTVEDEVNKVIEEAITDAIKMIAEEKALAAIQKDTSDLKSFRNSHYSPTSSVLHKAKTTIQAGISSAVNIATPTKPC